MEAMSYYIDYLTLIKKLVSIFYFTQPDVGFNVFIFFLYFYFSDGKRKFPDSAVLQVNCFNFYH